MFSELSQSGQNKSIAPVYINISYYLFVFISFIVAAEVMKFLYLNEVIVLLVTITGAFSGESNKKNV